MTRLHLLLALSWVLLVGFARALEVTPGSSCASFCLDDGQIDSLDPSASSTNSTDITCRDDDFSTAEKGIKFKNCLECLAKSDQVQDEESDLHWYLYNLRYTLSSCLFGFPGTTNDSKVQSPCIIDHACRPLEAPLSGDDLAPEALDTWGYCEANEGAFMANKTWTCVDCLRASNEQTYFSNFVIALQAGCRQRPEPGEVVSLTGSVFSTGAINATEPEEDILERPEGAGTSTLTTGAIVGIAVGVGLLLVGAVALFVIHRRRQRRMEEDEKSGYHDSHSNTPDPILPPDGGQMSSSLRTYSQQSHHGQGGGGVSGRGIPSGDYYDKLEDEMGGALSYNFDPRSHSRGPHSALPAHQAYLPRTVSRLRDEAPPSSNSRTPSPPAAVHRYTKSNPGGSIALQTYEPSSMPYPPQQQQPPSLSAAAAAKRRSASVGGGIVLPPPPPGPPPPKGQSTPSISMPSLSKLRLPKKYSPPGMTAGESAEIKISQPVIGKDERFADEPLKGGSVVNTDFRGFNTSRDVGDVPLRSGKSTLYG